MTSDYLPYCVRSVYVVCCGTYSVILYSLQSRPLALSVKLYRARGSAGNINVELGGGRVGKMCFILKVWGQLPDLVLILTVHWWCLVFRFLREELSSTQLDLIRSRSEVKVLLEELTACKTENLESEQFPNLLLSSLDKLFEDKQQQLWLVCDNGTATTIYSLLLFIRRLNNYTFSPT